MTSTNPYVKSIEHIETDYIIEIICKSFRIEKEEFYSKSRRKDIVKARKYLFFILRYFFNWTTKRIGRLMGTDHSNIMHHTTAMIDDFQTYPEEIQIFRNLLSLISIEFEYFADNLISKLIERPVASTMPLREKITKYLEIFSVKNSQTKFKETNIMEASGEMEHLIKSIIRKERCSAYSKGWHDRGLKNFGNVEDGIKYFIHKNPIKV